MSSAMLSGAGAVRTAVREPVCFRPRANRIKSCWSCSAYAVEETIFEVDHEWTLKTLLGYLYSTSFTSPGVLAGNRDRFEADLMASLLAHDRSGQYCETLRFHLILARPPSA